MDINDERRKKLEAGKEKLAAFRKKKAKSKKTAKDNGENINLKDVEALHGDTNNSSDVFAEGYVQPSENEQESKTSMSNEELLYNEVTNTENVTAGNPITPESIVKETGLYVCEENTNSNCCLENDDFKETDPCSDTETPDFQQALAQRDKLIGQLTHSLKSKADQQAENEELVSHVLTLSQQVMQLQGQLKEADNTLQEQLQFHGISGSALQCAKTQMLQLQSIVHEKDKELVLASQQLEKNHESLRRTKEENTRLAQNLSEKEEELNNLQQCYDAAVSSHEEKQEKEESEKSHQLVELQCQWKERESNLKSSIENQAKEIEGWRKCEQEWKERESELQQNYEKLVSHSQHVEAGKEERLKALEKELEQIRQQNEQMEKETDSLKRENEDKISNLCKLESLADEHRQLSSMHSNMVDEFEGLKSKNSDLEQSLRQLNVENEAMQSELENLQSKLADEQAKLLLSHKHQAELESKHSIDSDKLNNKINELQSCLSHTQECLTSVEKALEGEKEAVGVLQQELLAKQSSHDNTSQELESIMARNSELQTAVQSKEEQIKELENMLEERAISEEIAKSKGVDEEEKIKLEERVDSLTKQLIEFKDDCEQYVEQISQMETERLSTTEKVDTLNDELDKKTTTLGLESEKCKILESQLQMVEEEKGVLNENIKALNCEIECLKNDLDNGRLQTDIIGEELISLNCKLVDSQNLMRNNSDEHVRLVEQYESNIDKLTNELERKVSSEQDLNKLDAELKATEQSLQIKTKDCEELRVEVESMKEGESKSFSKIKDLEDELAILKQKHQETTEHENESLQNQEELQRQLESTVGQWQKLQLIVQEKEIELQNLHDDLDEQKRICNTMRRNHEDYLDSVQSDVDALKREKEQGVARVAELEGIVAGLHETLAAKDLELSNIVSKVEAVDSSSQQITLHLLEKEKELDVIVSDKEKVSAELSNKEGDIANLKERITLADSEVAHLSEALEAVRAELSCANSKRDENESFLKCLQNENKELSDKEKDSASQVESLMAQLADVQKYSSETDVEKNSLNSMIVKLEGLCAEKDELMSQEVMNRKDSEQLLDKEKQKCLRLHGVMSSLSQDNESKDELLVTNSVVLQEKVEELSQKEQDLLKACEELQHLRENLEKAKEDVKANETQLALNSNDKESVIKILLQRETELDHLNKEREELHFTIETLKAELKETEMDAEKQAEEINNLNTQLSHLQTILSENSTRLSKEQMKFQALTEELNSELQQSLRLKGTLSSLSNDVQDKDNSLMQQCVLLDEKMAALSCLEAEFNEKDKHAIEMEDKNKELEARIRELTSKESSQENEIADLKERLDKHLDELTEISAANIEHSEQQTQLEQVVRKQERDMVNMQQDNEILQKECCDLRSDLQEKENKNNSLMQEVDLMKSAIETSNEEKEMLKNNFDACLEEMHQKSAAQEIEMGHLKSKMVEESRSRDLGQEEMKEVYLQQLAQMEDKLMEMERAKIQVEKVMSENDSKLERVKDDYEQQVSEIELSLHAAQSEVTKMKDTISKTNTDHENELTDLKSLHEMQMSELMENYLTLEKSMTEVQKNVSDQAENMKQERMEMEQSFESLMSEMDERKRRSDSDIIRLKKQQDEMTKDHEGEIKALEKKYETQLFDLEDRCSVTSSELERVRKSVVGVEGDFVEERRCLENKIDDLENIRRDLEIKCTILEDDIVLIKEHSNMREEEVKSILKTAAEKQSGMKCEMEELEEELRALKINNELSCESLKKEFESRIEDVNAENEHLKNRLKSFEMNAELDMEMKGHEEGTKCDENIMTKLEDMKKQMTALTDQNLSLKRRLLGHKSLEKKVRLLSSGVEDIRLPLEEPNEEEIILPTHMTMVTSTPSKKNYEDDIPFSPTAEEVSLIEGFVSETNAKPLSSQRFDRITPQQSADEEPDFVAEEDDRFEPEMVIEKAVDDFGDGQFKRNIHPIQDNEITEGFEPELSDQFFVEISEESNTEWPLELSVGLSPTSKTAPQSFGFIDEMDGVETDMKSSNNELNTLPYSVGDQEKHNEDTSLDKLVKQMKEDLEEEFAFKLRKQKQDIIIEYESKYENTEKELEQHFAQKEQSIKHDWEIKFAKAVKKMKKDFEKKLQKQSANQKGNLSKIEPADFDQEEQVTANQEEKDETSDVEEGSEGLGNVVEQLSKENQELAEVRDELLKQIEISQARGRHSRVQHELQSMLSEREKENSFQDVSSNDGVVEPQIVQIETTPSFASRPHAPISVDVQTNSNQKMETAERSPTVEAERILEELEDIEQQSSQDLPLEWELTNTIPVESDASVENAGGQHQSVWEVFGNRCKRQDCLEVRNRYRRLCQCVVTSFGIGEELLLDEGRSNFGEEDRDDRGCKMASNFKGMTKSDDKDNPDDEDDDEVDELFADNVALESELLSLAENMVLYKDAFMNKKSELEKENEFLTLELETESKSRQDEEVKFNHEKEEMKNRIDDLENKLASIKTNRNEIGFSNKEVMTDEVDQHDVNLLKSEVEKADVSVKEKQERIESLQMEIDYFKSQCEEELREYKENAETDIKALEEELSDLKIENNYLCLTHEGKEETITRLLTEIDQYVSEKDSINKTLSGKEVKLLDLHKEITNLTEKREHLQSALIEKEDQLLLLGNEVQTVKSELEDKVKKLASKETQLETMNKESATLKDDYKDLQSVLTEKSEFIAGLDTKVTQLKAEIEDTAHMSSVKESNLEKEISDLKDKIDELQSILDAKDEEIENQNSDVKKLTSQMEDSVKNSSGMVQRLESEIATLEDQSRQLRTDLQERDATLANLKLEVDQLKSDLKNKEKIVLDKDSSMKILGNEFEDKDEQIASLQSICSKYAKMVKSLEFEVAEINDHLTGLKLENNRLHMKVEEQESCQRSSEDTVKILEGRVSSLQDDNSKLLSDVETNRESFSRSEVEIDNLHAHIEDLKQENSTLLLKAEDQQREMCKDSEDDKNTIRMLKEQVSSFQEDNNNLQSIVETNKESLSKSELEIDSLGSELHDLSTRLEDLQNENERLMALQDEIFALKDQNNNLLDDQTKKQEVITELNEEISGLRAQLVEYEETVGKFNELSNPVEAEIVSECYSGSESSSNMGIRSDDNTPPQSDIVQEDEIIPVKSKIAEQQAANEPIKETDNDVKSFDNSQTENSMSGGIVDSSMSPLYDSTLSVPAESMISSSSSGMLSPSELQDQALAEELNQLKKDLRETKAIYSRENSLLHEALEREKRVKDFVISKNDAESNPGTGSSDGDIQEEKKSECFNPETDMLQRLAVCLEQNKMLEEENGKLRTKIRKQEAVVLIYKHRLSEKEHDSELWRKSLTGQLQALQKQRDDLVQLLRNQEMGLSSSCPQISEAIGQAALKEESLRRVQDDLMEKMEELDHLHQMLTQRQVELQHCDMERRHLEQLCVLKDQTEMQLMKQKRLMEEQVSEIEHRLKEREVMLAEEKTKLMEELREKDDRLLEMSQPQSPTSPLSVSSPNRSYSMGDLSSSMGATSFGIDLNSSAEEADQHHLKAIETLREKLRLEYSVRSSRLAESQASTVASYWLRHQSSKDDSQNFDS